jgi:hypothetical protein
MEIKCESSNIVNIYVISLFNYGDSWRDMVIGGLEVFDATTIE